MVDLGFRGFYGKKRGVKEQVERGIPEIASSRD
jgi:hypothetical protein